MKKIIVKSLLIGLICLIVYVGMGIWMSYHGLNFVRNTLHSEKILKQVKICIIADLHDYSFSENNSDIVLSIKTQEPDIICLVGDMIDRDSESPENIVELVKQLVMIAPVYYAMGNHEYAWEDAHDDVLEEYLQEAGAVILDDGYTDLIINEQSFRIGGFYGYASGYNDAYISELTGNAKQNYDFLTDFQNTDSYKIMLSHRPDSFIFGDASTRWDIDLVVSGHLHGGQVVLPFFGGVYGGDQGYFPEYVHGLYKKDNINLLITSGLSTSKESVPRWNNPPEIVVLELLPEDSN